MGDDTTGTRAPIIDQDPAVQASAPDQTQALATPATDPDLDPDPTPAAAPAPVSTHPPEAVAGAGAGAAHSSDINTILENAATLAQALHDKPEVLSFMHMLLDQYGADLAKDL